MANRFSHENCVYIRNMLLRRGARLEDVEDIVQNTMVKAWRKRAQFRGEAKWTSWLVRIAINEHRMFKRVKIRPLHDTVSSDFDLMESDAPSQYDVVRRKEQLREVMSQTEKLTADQREALGVFLSEERLCDAAPRLGITLSTAKTRRLRALRDLKDLVKGRSNGR